MSGELRLMSGDGLEIWESSATGVAFTRNPATGDNKFYGE